MLYVLTSFYKCHCLYFIDFNVCIVVSHCSFNFHFPNDILKSRDIILPGKVHVVFPVVRYGCGSWTIRKAEHQRIDAFELWCWRFPWTARRSNQSILKEMNPEYSLQGLMLKLKLQYFAHQRADSFEKTLMPGKIEGRRRKE